MRDIPNDRHITYEQQYRKCGKASCSTCRNGQGHGPYTFAYWKEGDRLRNAYLGKQHIALPEKQVGCKECGAVETVSGRRLCTSCYKTYRKQCNANHKIARTEVQRVLQEEYAENEDVYIRDAILVIADRLNMQIKES